MERLQRFLAERGQDQRKTWILVEQLGRKEDDELELDFRSFRRWRRSGWTMPHLDIRFMDNKHNSARLQMADLLAYPVARHIIAPDQPNRAYDLAKSKFRRSGAGKIRGFWLRIFP